MRPVVLSWFFMLGLACVSPVLAAELNLEMRKASQELNALLPYIYDDDTPEPRYAPHDDCPL